MGYNFTHKFYMLLTSASIKRCRYFSFSSGMEGGSSNLYQFATIDVVVKWLSPSSLTLFCVTTSISSYPFSF